MESTSKSQLNRREIQLRLEKHKQELRQKFGVSHIGIFGSYARDEADPKSDIDFVVEIENPDLFVMSALQRYLENLFHREVDVVRLRNRMNPHLKKRIDQDVKYV